MAALGGHDHYRRWDSKLLELELEYLKKEIEHLERKTQERELTEWEAKRIADVQREKKRITYRISSASYDRSRFENL